MSEKIWKKLVTPWIPEKANDEISGILVKFEEEVGKNKSYLYSIETKDSIKGVWGCSVLDSKLKFFGLGDSIKIIFLGKKQGQEKEYKDYDVFVGCDQE